jgi:hypothetical protein
MNIELTVKELALLSNALNEVRNGIDLPEFQTRLGASYQEADDLLMKLTKLARETRQGRQPEAD